MSNNSSNGYSIPLLGDAVRVIRDIGFPIAAAGVLAYVLYTSVRIGADQLVYMAEADKRREQMLVRMIDSDLRLEKVLIELLENQRNIAEIMRRRESK